MNVTQTQRPDVLLIFKNGWEDWISFFISSWREVIYDMGCGWMRKEMPSSVSLGRAEYNTSIGSLELLRTRKPMLRAKCLQLYGSKRQNCGHLYLKGSLPFHFPHLVRDSPKGALPIFALEGSEMVFTPYKIGLSLVIKELLEYSLLVWVKM